MSIGKRHALIWGPFFLFIVAFVLHVNQIYVMFAALGLLAPVSYMLGRRKLAGIVVSRHCRSVMTAGEHGKVSISVHNSGRLRQFFLRVADALPDGLESPEGGEVLLDDLPPDAEGRQSYTVIARRRGAYRIGPARLETSDFLGLYGFSMLADAPAEVLVYPRPIPIPNLWPRATGGRTPNKASRRIIGPSTELFSLRDYLPGDDRRKIAWKASARRNKLTVIQTEQVEATECAVILDLQRDAHAGQGDDSTIEYAVVLAASLAAEATGRGSNVGLIAEGARNHSVVISGGPRQQTVLLEALARATADGEDDLSVALARHQGELPPGCGVAVVSPCVSPDTVAVATRLRTLGHPVSWFALDPHSFGDGEISGAADHGRTIAALAAAGARVFSIKGDAPLETSLWRRAAHGR